MFQYKVLYNTRASPVTPLLRTQQKVPEATQNEHTQTYKQRYRELPGLVLLGLGTGAITAILILIFRSLIELPDLFLPFFNGPDDLEELPPLWRFLIPAGCATLLGIYWKTQSADNRRIGITHIHERLSYHHGNLPVPNLVNQLIGAVLALGSGHPVGREGPGVHIGAALSSWMGLKVGLPFSSQRLLVGCGSAAAIAALFNLPLAGILFAMEVILLEYNLLGFTAIIISAVSADTVTQIVLGSPEPLMINTDKLPLHLELPLLLALSVTIAVGGWIFQQVQLYAVRLPRPQVTQRFMLAGAIVGGIAIYFPGVLTPTHLVTYQVIDGHMGTEALFEFTLIYLFITPLILGLGIPGGVIGPAMALGALAGALVSTFFNSLGANTDLAIYALIGMAAMMSAIIHAPLAALIAVFELTGDTQTLAAAMLVIVGSDLIMRSGFGKPSIFERLLINQGLSRNTQVYRRVMMSTSVQAVMSRSIALFDPKLDTTALHLTLAQCDWMIRQEEQGYLLLKGGRSTDIEGDKYDWDNLESYDAPPWIEVKMISSKASLLQALDQTREAQSEMLVVQQRGKPIGVISEEHILSYYRDRAE